MDVALAELDPVAKRHAWAEGPTAALRRSLDETRGDRRRHMRRRIAKIGRGTLRTRVGRVTAAVTDRPAPVDVRRAIADQLIRRADQVTEHATRCGTLYSVERLHALRIAVKKLRYTLEIADGGARPSAGAAMGMLRTAQQRMGRLHDVQILLGAVQSAAGAAPGAAVDWPVMLEDLERECRERHAEIVRHLPALTDGVRVLKQDASMTLRTGRRTMAKAAATPRGGGSGTGTRRAMGRSA
jgi:CHAD domain-containing protein